jgi:hypothetical protein
MSLFRKTQLLECVDGKSRVAQLGKLPRLGFNVLAHTAFGMDQVQRRSRLTAFRHGQVAGNAMLLSSK